MAPVRFAHSCANKAGLVNMFLELREMQSIIYLTMCWKLRKTTNRASEAIANKLFKGKSKN